MSNSQGQEFPPVFDTHIKLDDTAKGCRISVSVYGNGRKATIEDAVAVYLDTRKHCEGMGVILAPIEVKEK